MANVSKPTDEEIEKYLTELTSQTRDSDRKAAIKDFAGMAIKWARDQQPKLKTLEWEGRGVDLYSKTVFGTYVLLYKSRLYFAGHTEDDEPISCDNEEHGKQLAQADYERKINELYEKRA